MNALVKFMTQAGVNNVTIGSQNSGLTQFFKGYNGGHFALLLPAMLLAAISPSSDTASVIIPWALPSSVSQIPAPAERCCAASLRQMGRKFRWLLSGVSRRS